jgi:WD40 repeat protein
MSYCLNPDCLKPNSNPIGAKFCQHCGFRLLLQERYRTLQLIGQGGFGRTFLAVDESQPTKPRCVIKQFFPQTANRQKAAQLFEQEATRLETLGNHPQIPQFLAHFEQDNYQYLIQEFIEGLNLDQVLRAEGAFSEEQIRDLLNSLLPVIEYIHSQNVIHRDIKPENIIRCALKEGNKWVLVDFGAAKYATGTALARTGTVIGSAGYAAPEQTGGKAVFSSDLYSLGVTCLHLLTETAPFDLYSFSEATWVWRDYLRHPVSYQLGRVLDKMVEMATSRRFQLASEVLDALKYSPRFRTRKPRVIVAKSTPQLPQAVLPDIASSTKIPLQNWRYAYTIKGHTQAIRSLAITPDAQFLASASDDKTIKFWQLTTGQEISIFRGHSSSVCSIAMSADGQLLASGSDDKTIKLWQLSTGLQIGTIKTGGWFSGDASSIYAIAMSPNGQLLASLSNIGTVKLWNLKTGQEVRRLDGDASWVQSIAISPNGRILAGGSGDTIKLWSLKTRKELCILKGHKSWVRAVAFSPDGKILASGSDDTTIKLWDFRKGQEIFTLKGHNYPVYSIAFSPIYKNISKPNEKNRTNPELGIEQILASGSDDTNVKLWNTHNGQEICTLAGHTSWVHAVAFSPDGQILASGSGDNTINIWRCD